LRRELAAAGGNAVEKELSDYRQFLIGAEQKSQEDYDKTVLALSGGALGISFAFLDKLLVHGPIVRPGLLVLAWSSWAVSVILVLVSYYLSRVALANAIRQTDKGEIRSVCPGGVPSVILGVCNCGSGLLFVLGVFMMTAFVRFNMGV
jgi:hypothetical protein